MSHKKFVIFVDISNFSYKNSLLTDSQVETILSTFENIIFSVSKTFDIQVIKSLWDAYMLLWSESNAVYNFCVWVLNASQVYDIEKKIDIFKLWLRIGISHGEITKNISMDLDDYFGESINLASRIMEVVPEWQIFSTKNLVDDLPDISSQSLWKYDFHGIISSTELYAITDISCEELSKVLILNNSLYKECDTLIYRSACVSAILSAQPIPFVESFNIIGIHLYMIIKISSKFWKPVSLQWAKKIFQDIVAPLGLTYIALQWANTVVKIALPGIGWYLYVPLSFASTFALWKVYTAYFYYQIGGQKLSEAAMKSIFFRQKDSAKLLAKSRKKEILKTGKQFYKDVMSIKKTQWYYKVQKEIQSVLKKK